MQKSQKYFYAPSRSEWRKWLQDNHTSAREIWLYIFKKKSSTQSVSYNDAVEEALCFGWIDGLTKAYDDDKYIVRFSPRKPGSTWSVSNIGRAEKMIGQGLMTEAGMVKISHAKASGEWEAAFRREDTSVIPEDLAGALKENPAARDNFERFSPTRKKQFIYWIMSAKTPETRKKRITETVRLSGENRGLG